MRSPDHIKIMKYWKSHPNDQFHTIRIDNKKWKTSISRLISPDDTKSFPWCADFSLEIENKPPTIDIDY